MEKAKNKIKNKKGFRYACYIAFGCSLLVLGFTGFKLYDNYEKNLELKQSMENIIEAHEQTAACVDEAGYYESFIQDETLTDGSTSKVIISFPNAR